MTLKIIGPNDPALDVLDNALKNAPKANLELRVVPWNEYRDLLTETLTAETAPNQAVFVPGHIWLPEFVAADYLADIGSLQAELPTEVVERYNPQDIIPAVAEECRVEGRQYQLPFFTDGHLIFYRADLIQLNERDGVPVLGTAEMAQMAAHLHLPPAVYGLALKADPSEIFTDFLPYLWEAGGRIFDEEAKPDLANETNIAALQFYCGLRSLCPPQTHTYGNAEIAEIIRNGEAALVANWGGQTAPLLLNADGRNQAEYKCAVFPVPWNATWGIAIPKNQPKTVQKDLLSILMRILNKEQDKEITRVAGSPVRESSYVPEELQKYSWLAAQREMLARAKPLPARPQLGAFLGLLYEAVHAAFTGKKSPAEALQSVQNEALKA